MTYYNGNDLLATVFPPPKWAVPHILAEGLNVLAGAPKLGKSWLALDVALAVSRGTPALGSVQVDQGDVIYLALEDTGRRLQDRVRALMDRPDDLSRFHVTTEFPRADQGGIEKLETWMASDKLEDLRIVIVDVLAKFRKPTGASGSAYESDYGAVSELKRLADTYGVSMLVLHHTRKAVADDWLDTLSGTQGIAGAADAALRLTKSRGQADGQLDLTGRDVDEVSHALRFEAGRWSLLGSSEEWSKTPEELEVIRILEDGPITPKALADRIEGLTHEAAKKRLARMAERGHINTDGTGAYRGLSLMSPVSPVPVLGDRRDKGDRGYRGCSECDERADTFPPDGSSWCSSCFPGWDSYGGAA